MDRLDREIMKTILAEEHSMYGIEKAVRENIENSNYATVWRHIKKMQKDGLLNLVQKMDKRRTKMPTLTRKGLATLLIEGDLQEEELLSAGQKLYLAYFGESLLMSIKPFMAGIFSDALLRIKPKVNLKFFDEEYFDELLLTSFVESLLETLPEVNFKGDLEQLQKLLTRSRKIAEKHGASQIFEKGFEFGKSLRLRKEKEE